MSKVEEEIEKAMKEWHEDVLESVYTKVYHYAFTLLTEALVNRQTAPGKHNYTGNLLNSIVVCVYKDGNPDIAYFASGEVKGAIRAKMTAPKHYHFEVDYEGTESEYDPSVVTDEGLGAQDAKDFFSEYRPENKDKFTIVVAYTTEYASWVENARHTAGFAYTYSFAKKTAKHFLGLETASYRQSYSVVEAPF